MSEEDKIKPASDWLILFGIFGVLLLVAAVFRLGADNYLLRLDLSEAECIASHWKAKAKQQQAPECSLGNAQLPLR